MRRAIEWKDKTDDGEKRVVRVTYFSGMVKWQFQIGGGTWDYDTKPTVEDWEHLVQEIDQRYQRRRVPYKDLVLAQNLLEKERRLQKTINEAKS